jgi:hypothetical protein
MPYQEKLVKHLCKLPFGPFAIILKKAFLNLFFRSERANLEAHLFVVLEGANNPSSPPLIDDNHFREVADLGTLGHASLLGLRVAFGLDKLFLASLSHFVNKKNEKKQGSLAAPLTITNGVLIMNARSLCGFCPIKD